MAITAEAATGVTQVEDIDALDFIGRPYWFDRPSQAEGEDA